MSLPELFILDVGHGNCAILRDTRAVTVIDCPPTSILLETLGRLGIDVIDHVLISHADLDHAGGLLQILDEVTIRNVYINPDADNKSKTWMDIRTALEQAEEAGTEVHTSLTSKLSKKIDSGQIEIEILAPSTGVALGGSGGEDLEGRRLSSHSVCAVIGLVHNSYRVALLPGDLDEIGLDNLLKRQKNMRAHVLIFPHHERSCYMHPALTKMCSSTSSIESSSSNDSTRYGANKKEVLRRQHTDQNRREADNVCPPLLFA